MPKLKVKIVECRGLPAADLNGKSDPFVVISTADTTNKTKVVKETLNPTFNQEFEVTLGDPNKDAVGFVVYDWDRFGPSDFLGKVALMAWDLRQGVPKDFWAPLTKGKDGKKDKKDKKDKKKDKKKDPHKAKAGGKAMKSAGEIHLILTAMDFTGAGPAAGTSMPGQHGGAAPVPGQYGAPPPGQYGAPPPGQYGAPPPGQYGVPPPGQYGAPPPGQYGAPPPGQYGAPPPGQYAPPPGQYGAPPPGQYGAPPPGQYGAPMPGQYGAPPMAGHPGAAGTPARQAWEVPSPYTGRVMKGWHLKGGVLKVEKTKGEKNAKAAKKVGKGIMKGLGVGLGLALSGLDE